MEQPIFTAKAHVFHIDPQTKRSWIPASQFAVNVNFYYDSGRSLYRIISVEDTKAIINSTITPNMTFTKTSQKFGQWTDIRANTIYGLGFNSESELNKFIEKFQEVKEATKNAAQQKFGNSQNSNTSTQQPNQIIAPPSNLSSGSNSIQQPKDLANKTDLSKDLLNSGIKQPLAIHQRSQSLSGLQLSKSFIDSPKHGTTKMGSQLFLPQTSAEAQLKHENDRLKVALAQSSSNAKKWEVELQTLKNNNTRLTNALQESTANVEEWKKQLSTLKEENSKMRIKIMELEACNGNNEALEKLKEEFEELRFCNFQLESLNNDRLVEINYLKAKLNPDNNEEAIKDDFKLTEKNKPIINEVNTDLANCVTKLKNIHQKLNSIIN